jgi:serine O-acetyltransferase
LIAAAFDAAIDCSAKIAPVDRVLECGGDESVGEDRVQPDAPDAVSATEPDWSREAKRFFEWAPSRSLLAALRGYQGNSGRGPIAALARKWAVARHRFWSAVTGADIPINCRIGGGLLLPHPNGIVIHPDSEVGPNCLIFQQVTLGHRRDGVPRIGGHVDIGAGAVLLGGITVGDHARIGANALVLDDVPAGGTMVAPSARLFEP